MAAIAGTRPAARYGVYAYRSLAVPHPEVYLRADAMFAEIISKMPGSRSTWRGADVRNIDVFRRVKDGEAAGPAFALQDWAPNLDSINDDGVMTHGASWLDLRASSAAVLLQGTVQQFSTVETAMLRYTQYRRFGRSADSLFVVIDRSGKGYLIRDSQVFSMTSNVPLSNPREISPALVLNENDVYYPLFDRDDREHAPALKRACARLGESGQPEVSGEDMARITTLRSSLVLSTEKEVRLASLIALGITDVGLAPVAAAWRTAVADSSSLRTIVRGFVHESFYWADRLCPKTADFAAIEVSDEFSELAPALEHAYLGECGRPVNPADSNNTEREAGGYIWSFEFLDLVLEDIVRLRTGQPSSQALAMSAILDCRHVENTRVGFDFGDSRVPNQYWVLGGSGRWQFNLGRWNHIADTTSIKRTYPLGMTSYGMNSRWTGLASNRIFSDSDGLETLSELSSLVPMLPGVLIRVPAANGRQRNLELLIYDLTNDAIEIAPLPWSGS